jgi:cell division protein FtsI (penicillin-binding protein 3)
MTAVTFDDSAADEPRVAPARVTKARPRQKPRADRSRIRIRLMAVVFTLAFTGMVARLVMLGIADAPAGSAGGSAASAVATSRPDLVDRNGEVLAADIKTASLYGEPRNILDPDEAAEAIVTVLPDLDVNWLRKRLSGTAGFAWIKREITPQQQKKIHALGIPGIGFLTENRRFYPGGATAAHVLGAVNVDNQGIAGLEKYIDDKWLAALHAAGFARGEPLDPVRLSLDISVQHILRDELVQAMERYRAIAAAGIILNVKTGEVIAMASLPDYDPNDPADALKPDRLNRVSAGVFEVGSIFKSFTFAMALDTHTLTLNDSVDASRPIRVGGFTIDDYRGGKKRVLSVPEVFYFSSNIGTAKMALQVGSTQQQAYLKRFGFFNRPVTELPEVAAPMVPKKWPDVTAMTVAFGHGIAVSPLQVAIADASVVNGGKLIPATFFPRTEEEAQKLAVQVISPETSASMRFLLQTNVEKGGGTRAAVPGYLVGGKTGTAEKVEHGRYVGNKRLNSFLAAFPMDDPQYVVLVTLDEPKPEKEGHAATAGLNAAPTVAAVIRRSAALLDVKPRTIDQNGVVLVSN